MLSAKTTSPCSYYSFGNFVNEADGSPIEFQFTANFLQIPEKFCEGSTKNAQNGAIEGVSRVFSDEQFPISAAGRPPLNPFALA